MLPLTAYTRGLLNAERLALMQPGGYLINIARGGLLDESAFIAALDGGYLAGAMFDVCVDEPAPGRVIRAVAALCSGSGKTRARDGVSAC